METDPESLLDRIRQVEEKVENGVTVVREREEPERGTAPPKPAPELAAAVPEDVQRIVAGWPSIVGNAENPMKVYLKTARLSLGGDNRLILVLQDGVASDYFMQHEENRQQLESLLADFAGKKIETVFQTVRSRQEFEENFVDLSRIVRMEIEEEE